VEVILISFKAFGGLELRLGYDIIKAHGSEIKVETKEGEGSEFIIQLPLNKES
jgi:two-component system NtrC family sensor kinase